MESVTSSESVGNDSVSERLKHIHSTFAALRSQSALGAEVLGGSPVLL